jgi:hypothetical protein
MRQHWGQRVRRRREIRVQIRVRSQKRCHLGVVLSAKSFHLLVMFSLEFAELLHELVHDGLRIFCWELLDCLL